MDIFHIFSHINLLKCFNGGCLTITNIINAAVKSDDQFLFTAPVMIPGKPDCDFERGETPFTVDEIRFFKKSFDDPVTINSIVCTSPEQENI